jgi:hypothetical protein
MPPMIEDHEDPRCLAEASSRAWPVSTVAQSWPLQVNISLNQFSIHGEHLRMRMELEANHPSNHLQANRNYRATSTKLTLLTLASFDDHDIGPFVIGSWHHRPHLRRINSLRGFGIIDSGSTIATARGASVSSTPPTSPTARGALASLIPSSPHQRLEGL